MKTSNFFLRLNNPPRAGLFCTGILSAFLLNTRVEAQTWEIKEFGNLFEKVQLSSEGVWTEFVAKDPLLWVYRARKLTNGACTDARARLEENAAGVAIHPSPKLDWKGWEPWSEKDLDSVVECTSFPCKVKFNKAEVATMASSVPTKRRETFEHLVGERVLKYVKNFERKEYEFPGDPKDPWEEFKTQGLAAGLPSGAGYFLRRTDFMKDSVHSIRQVVHRELGKQKTGASDRSWVRTRDLYTDHYFDSWGEWGEVRCEGGSGVMLLVLLVEFDLLKKSDLISMISRGSMRSAVREQGQAYLKDWEAKLLVKK